MLQYTIWAYSPSLNQEQRWFNLQDLNPVTDANLAQRLADSHAQVFNSNAKMNATDWVGRIKLEELGITTVPGYISN